MLPYSAHAVEIDAGEMKIEIPPPPGYVQFTPGMKFPNDALTTLMTSQKVQATFIPEFVATSSNEGKAIGFGQFYTVRIHGKDPTKAVGPEVIQRLKHWARHERESVPGMLEEFPVHAETEQMVEFSSLLTGLSTGEEKPASVAIQSTTLLRVKDRIISLEVVDAGNDLHWAQSTLRQWADSILATNEGTPPSSR